MAKESKRTYKSYREWASPSKQTEYVAPTPLLEEDGTLLAKGWARHNVFAYDRNKSKPLSHRKEWDFYQVSNGRYMAQINFANITKLGFATATLVDLKTGKTLGGGMAPFLGGRNKHILPDVGDAPHAYEFKIGNCIFAVEATEEERIVRYKQMDVEAEFRMHHLPQHENITTVLPFEGKPTNYFMTTKLNCMPTDGYFKVGDKRVDFSQEDTFGVLDWGRVNTPYKLVWYWGNGATRIQDEEGKEHIFGFEITWAIGDESNATETCMFLDGKAYKFGAVDVKNFPKGRYMEPWVFESEDGKFNLTMTPTFDNHSDINALVYRMNTHQVHGLWNGWVEIEGKKYEIKDMYAFCEYVENRW